MNVYEKLKLCAEYYELYGRIPPQRIVFKNFKLGEFVTAIKRRGSEETKKAMENIFHKEFKPRKPRHVLSDEEKIELCRHYYEEHKQIPKYHDKYQNFSVGVFVSRARSGNDSQLKEELDKIFGNISLTNNYENIIRACSEYYELHHKIPHRGEYFKDLNLGRIIRHVRYGCYAPIKDRLEEIFHAKIDGKTRYDLSTYIKLFQEFNAKYNRYPKSREIFKGVKIGHILQAMKNGGLSELKYHIEKEIYKRPLEYKSDIK